MTLGTNTNSNISAFRSVLDGLSDLNVEVVITVGFDGDLSSFGPEPDNAHIERYVPHSLLLPECALSICHGGLGTTLGSLAQGLPVLLLPQGADQYSVSQLVFEAGAGLVLRPADVNPAAIQSGVLTLLNEPTYREAAHRLRGEIAAMPGPEDVVHLLEELVAVPQ
jgi:UDP:flavonoid glycosyltransferase YjiC (YdhE family)